MTVIEIFNKVDNLEPNQYTQKEKLDWLNQLDGQIFDELILTHEHEDGISFTPHSDASDEPLVPSPYGMDIYVNYLKAMIAESNHEMVKYNASMTLFNSAYQRYASWYNRNNMPVQNGNRLFF